MQLAQETSKVEEQKRHFETIKAQLSDHFKSLSTDALKHNNQLFMDLARQNFEKFQTQSKSELDHRHRAIQDMVKPIQQSLAELQQSSVRLDEQVRTLKDSENLLRQETHKLSSALRKPSVRGRWGELQLKRVVELAGMLNHCDFLEQSTVDGDEGRLRPDMVIRLPGDKQVVIDAKAPLDSFLQSLETTDEHQRLSLQNHHAKAIRDHMNMLSAKKYWSQFTNSPEFVVLFLPGESFFSAALEQDPTLIEFGVERKVFLSTPVTLLTLLRAIAHGWQQQAIAQNAEKINQLGRELYERLMGFVKHLSSVGKSLDHAVDAYNRGIGSLEDRVLVSARRFAELNPGYRELSVEKPVDVEKRSREVRVSDGDARSEA
jgi:DNA recombination protein RmuC